MPSAYFSAVFANLHQAAPQNIRSNDEVTCYILSRCTVVIICVHIWRNATGVHSSKAPLLDGNCLTAVPVELWAVRWAGRMWMWTPEGWAFPSAHQVVTACQEEMNRNSNTNSTVTRKKFGLYGLEHGCLSKFHWLSNTSWPSASDSFLLSASMACYSHTLSWDTQEWIGWLIRDLTGNFTLNSNWY